MNAIELLKADHEKVRGLFQQLTDTTSRAEKTRVQLLEKIRLELDVHTQIEEEIFYPAFRQAAEESDDKEMIFEALEEHRAAGELVLPDLLETEVGSEKFGGRAKVLKDLVEHHAEEEEKEMFKRARQVLSREQLDELGVQMAARKEELLELGAEAIELMKKQQGQVGTEQSPPRASLQ
ncbi:hemerythrin domain-containing protein [Lysobacter humi (ex Lee et al. 2017)]